MGLDDVIGTSSSATEEQMRDSIEKFSKFAKPEKIFFTPDEIQAAMDRNLAAALRQLADAIEAGMIDGKCLDCNGHGFSSKSDQRAHVMLRIDLAAPIRQTVLEGESREEFERDRMGQTGEDNARKMFGK